MNITIPNIVQVIASLICTLLLGSLAFADTQQDNDTGSHNESSEQLDLEISAEITNQELAQQLIPKQPSIAELRHTAASLSLQIENKKLLQNLQALNETSPSDSNSSQYASLEEVDELHKIIEISFDEIRNLQNKITSLETRLSNLNSQIETQKIQQQIVQETLPDSNNLTADPSATFQEPSADDIYRGYIKIDDEYLVSVDENGSQTFKQVGETTKIYGDDTQQGAITNISDKNLEIGDETFELKQVISN